MIDRFFAGAAEEMITALIEYRGLSKDEAEWIRQLLDEADSAPPKKAPKHHNNTVRPSSERRKP